jgi:hypothetical protein
LQDGVNQITPRRAKSPNEYVGHDILDVQWPHADVRSGQPIRRCFPDDLLLATLSFENAAMSRYDNIRRMRDAQFAAKGGDRKSKSQPATLIPKLSDLGVTQTALAEANR